MFLQFCELFRLLIVFRHIHMGDFGLAHCADLRHLLLLSLSPLSKLFHDLCIQLCVEELPKDHLFVV